ncbi:hypothetical protein ACFIQF_22395 [Comamonas sp. J-3]|uniref:hypothetical protein n=1 Tax=Comamonas trifloxystrobinivorans TaxID=3350256 RepID=UPI00372C8018
MSGVNGTLVAAAPVNPLLAQIPMYASRMTPVAAGITEAVETGAYCSANIRPFALGINEHLDEFAQARGAMTWKYLPNPMQWKSGVTDALLNPRQPVHFNLDGVNVWNGVQRASAGCGGATDWELLQINRNPQYWDSLQFWENGQHAPNPFK